MGTSDELSKLSDSLLEARDRLRVQVNLAGKDARDEWEELESKWEHFRGKLKVIQDEVDEAGEETRAAATLLGQEIKDGYERVRERMDS